MSTTRQLLSSIGQYSSLADHPDTKSFSSSTAPTLASNHYANYDFIAILGLAQRLHTPFLPITWQAGLGHIGEGGQARINQALANIQTSFAFKHFDHPDSDPFQRTIQEMAVLSHAAVQEHAHIVKLEGICWDIPSEHDVWPVLVFQKTHLGDLQRFARLKKFENLLMEDRLNLCTDIGIAIRDMHHNGNALR